MTHEQRMIAQQAMLNYIRNNRAHIARLIARDLLEATWDIAIADAGVDTVTDETTSEADINKVVCDMLELMQISASVVVVIGGEREIINVESDDE